MFKTNFIIIVYFYLQTVEREAVLFIIEKVQFLNLINDKDNVFNAKKLKKNDEKREFTETNDIIF